MAWAASRQVNTTWNQRERNVKQENTIDYEHERSLHVVQCRIKTAKNGQRSNLLNLTTKREGVYLPRVQHIQGQHSQDWWHVKVQSSPKTNAICSR